MRKRTFPWLFVAGTALLVAAGCQTQPPQTEYRPTATIKDIMDSVVDPSADFFVRVGRDDRHQSGH